MGISFSFSAERWASQVEKMASDLGVQTKEVLKQELVLLIQKIIQFTPPQNRAQGMSATRSDIAKVVQPFDVSNFRNTRLKVITESRDIAAFNAFFGNVRGSLRGATAVDAFSVPDLHTRRRTAYGRVSGRFQNTFVIGANDIRFLRDYTKRKTDNVGIARSGWLPALAAVGGVSAVTDLAGWNTRHGSEFGSYVSRLDDPDKPSIDAINSTPWAVRKEEGARIIRNAQDSRSEGITLRLQFLVRYVRDNAGLAAA